MAIAFGSGVLYDTYGGVESSCATQGYAAVRSNVTAVSNSVLIISIAPAKSVQYLDSAVPDIGTDHWLLCDPVIFRAGRGARDGVISGFEREQLRKQVVSAHFSPVMIHVGRVSLVPRLLPMPKWGGAWVRG